MKDDFKKEPKMLAQLLTHDNHASGLGGEHSEDSLENHMTFTVHFFTYFPITLHVSVKPEINYVIIFIADCVEEALSGVVHSDVHLFVAGCREVL